MAPRGKAKGKYAKVPQAEQDNFERPDTSDGYSGDEDRSSEDSSDDMFDQSKHRNDKSAGNALNSFGVGIHNFLDYLPDLTVKNVLII